MRNFLFSSLSAMTILEIKNILPETSFMPLNPRDEKKEPAWPLFFSPTMVSGKECCSFPSPFFSVPRRMKAPPPPFFKGKKGSADPDVLFSGILLVVFFFFPQPSTIGDQRPSVCPASSWAQSRACLSRPFPLTGQAGKNPFQLFYSTFLLFC